MSGKLSFRLNTFIQAHKELSIYLFFAVLSVFVLFFYSQDSYIYDLYNRWDSAWFFMCGKAWMNGMVPYVDFADSKGPLLWLIYGLGYLISPRDYTGVYWVTCVWYSFTYYFTYKLADIFLKNKRKSVLCAILMTVAFFNPLFHVETRAEDFCLLFITISLYRMSLSLYDDDHQDDRSTSLSFFWFGCCFSALLLIKFNYAAMQCIFPFCTAIYLIKNKRNIVRPCLYWILGAALTVLPFLTYFLIQGNFDDFINEYFINTTHTVKMDFSEYVSQWVNLIRYKKILILWVLTIISNCFIVKLIAKDRWWLLFCSVMFLIANYRSVNNTVFVYYYYLNSIFLLGIFVYLVSKLRDIKNYAVFIVFSLLTIVPVLYHYYYPFDDKRYKPFVFRNDDSEKKRFYDINNLISEETAPTIINLLYVERGYGITSETLPGCKYWAYQVGATAEMLNEQIESVKTGLSDYIYINDIDAVYNKGVSLDDLLSVGYEICYSNDNKQYLLARK